MNMKQATILVLIFQSLWLCSQDVPREYLTATIYLKSENALTKALRTSFKKGLGKKPGLDYFSISTEIPYINPEPIFLVHPEARYNLDPLNDAFAAGESHIEALKDIVPASDSRLVLFFSRPSNRRLVAEFFLDPNSNDNYNDAKFFGFGFMVLFVFDDQGFVKEAFWALLMN